MGGLSALPSIPILLPLQSSSSSSSKNSNQTHYFSRRKALIFTSSFLSCLNFCENSSLSSFSSALELQVDELQQEEDRVALLFQVPFLFTIIFLSTLFRSCSV